jgi:hypothetical protein
MCCFRQGRCTEKISLKCQYSSIRIHTFTSQMTTALISKCHNMTHANVVDALMKNIMQIKNCIIQELVYHKIIKKLGHC